MKLNRILAGLCLALCLSGAANAATLLPNGKQTFFNQNGAPLAGGTVTLYVPNTTTLKNSYKDAGQTILNTNPIVLDAAGRAVIYGAGGYRQVVKDAAGNLIWDQLTSDTSSAGSSSWGGTSTGTANAQVVNAANFTSGDGQSISFIAGFTNTGPTTLNPSGIGAISVTADTATGPITLSGGEIVAGSVVTVVYSATSGTFHASLPISSIPPGVIQEYAGSTAPAGFLFAAGQCVSRTTYARLFGVLSTTYGACDGSTTFAVPDMRGRVVAGKDNMGGTDAGRLTSIGAAHLTLGGTAGEATHTLTIAELPIVTPTGTVSVTFPAITYNRASINATGGQFGATGGVYGLDQIPTTAYAGSTSSFPLSVNSFGSGVAHNVVQPTIILNFIIKT